MFVGEVLQHEELERTGRIDGEGSILMDAPAYNNTDQLVAAAGGQGTEGEREEARKQWRAASCCFQGDYACDRSSSVGIEATNGG